MKEDNHFTYKSHGWKQFKKNKPAYISIYILITLIIIAILSPILSNQQPLYIKYKGQTLFPALSLKNTYEITDPTTGTTERLQSDITDWKHLKYESALFPPIAYSPGQMDYQNTGYKSPTDPQEFLDTNGNIIKMPLKFRHWLGTNKKGEDIAAGIIHGIKISLSIGILSMLIASLLGLFLGSIAGYFGDKQLQTTRGRFWTVIIGIIIAFHYAFLLRFYTLEDALATSPGSFFLQVMLSLIIFTITIILFQKAGKYIGKLPFLTTKVNIPIDTIISKTMEILVSLPQIILIITIAAIAKRSLVNVMLIIGLTSWTTIARLTRAEFMRIKQLDYIHAAKALGFSHFRIILRHVLANALAPALVAIAFGIAGAILIESSLSFLNIGVPLETVSWGRLLAEGREQFSAWWLVVFPGIAIFITVTIYNLIGEGLRDAFDPKGR
jgi:peptide/nickel transport system permease protein